MMLEVEASNGAEATQIAVQAGYAVDGSYDPIPLGRDGTSTFVLRGERSANTKKDSRITEWADAQFELFQPK